MVKRWAYYLAVLAGCLIFYFAYRQWMAWIVLIGVALLPLLSLALSLPAMLWARWRLDMPEAVTQGAELPLNLWLDCPLPPPRWQIPVLAKHSLTRKEWLLQPGLDCPTEHCGALDCSFRRGWVYDYMGLFRMPKKAPAAFRLWIRPKAVRPLQMPDPEKDLAVFWKPKPGGGFSENHELRLYRPGDSLRQIHWKLSGKTGQLIFREAMEISNRRLVLWLLHGGSPEELDRKLGRLLWVCNRLLEQKETVQVRCLTKTGTRIFQVDNERALDEMMKSLLCSPVTEGDSVPELGLGYLHCHIGGEPDEG
jgi:uncharacterized protein (DUF58 family)